MAVLIVVIVIVVLLAGFVVVGFNKLRRTDIGAQEALGGIDVQLTRRADLIPNLVETVKGYAAHESKTLEAVVAARNVATAATGPAQQAQAENALTGTLRSLFALSESYPDLKANQNFQQLQTELSSTEDRISYARQYYNDNVRAYNEGIQRFPTNLLAGAFQHSGANHGQNHPRRQTEVAALEALCQGIG